MVADAQAFGGGVLAWLGIKTGSAAWRVTNGNLNDPSSADVGQFARDHLPDNAVLLCDERKPDERMATMFYADRTCYPLGQRDPDEMARDVVQAGGLPFIVSRRSLPFPPST